MSHKVIAIINDGEFDNDPAVQKIRLLTVVLWRNSTEPFDGGRLNSFVYLTGGENTSQKNTAILNQIKTDLAAVGLSHVTDQDISIGNKFS